ncbi:bifunctional F-box-like-WD repeat-containing protein Ebi-like/WD40-YVTN repeat-like-containing domain superfamily/WD40 repeat/WD40-repeat-containing domain superfamily/Anaphase-promoting complex subunit 4 [Babesia duncani]|uniref:Anaphase-promoting complex subunit 4-like WD40 domain-containing protein n=1 Tax=Babesia duncani TaxID=323732 RepID=A0AAD9PLF0_9APIC|nr:bifunctional F-box-like-WD repeat-containing protein Ebi-like/WD40-YVTN repeat-like-containing domain superfamily/WD40 repeat/WD40-repeat-containing domain superfamily/Anaphase-promoting complex subunit 4 [Babesia duncani]
MGTYCHSAFAFNKECEISKNPYYSSHADKIPPNALISFIQKAMIYIYLEYHTDEMSGEQIACEEPFSFFRKHSCFRKTGQSHGLPLSQSVILSREREANADGASSGRNASSGVNRTGSGPGGIDLIDGGTGNSINLFQPIYVGPPQRRLTDKWQLFGYYKLYEYKDCNANATSYFNPVYESNICKRIENGPATVFKMPEPNNVTAACEVVTPVLTIRSTEDVVGITTCLQWRVDGQILCTGHMDGNVNIWSLDGLRLYSYKMCKDPITSVAFSGNKLSWEHGTSEMSPFILAVGSSKGDVILYQFDGRYSFVTQYNHCSVVTDIDWKDHSVVASASSDGAVMLYDTQSGQDIVLTDIATGNVTFMEWDPEGKFLAIVDNSNVLKVYKCGENAFDGKIVQFKAHVGNIVGGQWQYSPDEKITHRFYTIGLDKNLCVWDVVSETAFNCLPLDQVPIAIAANPGVNKNQIYIYEKYTHDSGIQRCTWGRVYFYSIQMLRP